MEKLINFTVNNLDIERLNNEKAIEAIFYIDFLLSHEKNIQEIQRFVSLKNQVLNRINKLDNNVNTV